MRHRTSLFFLILPGQNRRRFKLQGDDRLTPLLGVTGRLADSSAGLGRLRVVGTWFNGLYDGNYNGQEGDVFGSIYLKRENNAYSAEVWLGQSLNNDFSSERVFIDGVAFNMVIDPSKFYDMSIQMTDDGGLIFRIIDDTGLEETQRWVNDGLGVPNTILPVYPSSLPYKAIEVRAQSGAGEVTSYIDDIYIKGPPDGGDSVCMPIKSQGGAVVVICL